MSRYGKTRGTGAVGKARTWFEGNPGEHLTLQDMVSKFGFSSAAVARQAVYMLKHEGLVESQHIVFTSPDRPR